jgi:hypothetical protein
MEGESYLSSGFGIRRGIERRSTGWVRIKDIARVWMPGRLKGIQVGRQYGTPFLAATQVFDRRPSPRKWLALEQTNDAKNRFVRSGMILVTCSGSVGRPTIAYDVHQNTLISHDLLRVEPTDDAMAGWLYAFLLSSRARAIATGSQYGHIIKHLEPEHLSEVPIPFIDDALAAEFLASFHEIVSLRNIAYRNSLEADRRYAESIGAIHPSASESAFTAPASELFLRRRRLEASYFAPVPTTLRGMFGRSERLAEVSRRVWWMTRFKRFYGDAGIPYMSADELFTVNPVETKRILVKPDDDHEKYFVRRGWILMACSGQVYGLNGAALLATEYDERAFFSHDLIRIIPDESKIRAGYLLETLTHPTHGRPLVIRAAYGTSIPHLDPGDISAFPVARIDADEEAAIADLVESAAHSRATADEMERNLSREADKIIDRFISAPVALRLVSDSAGSDGGNDPAAGGSVPDPIGDRFRELADQWKRNRGPTSSLTAIAKDPAYQKIIAMGSPVVPHILASLEREPDFWFAALKRITKDDPITEEIRGDLRAMTKAWLNWGRAKNVHW